MMSDKEFAYWNNRITKLIKICKQKNLTIPEYLDILDKQELKKLRNTKIVIKDIVPTKFSCLHYYGKEYQGDDIEQELGMEHYKHEKELELN